MKWAGKPKRVKTTFNGRTERGKYIKPFLPRKGGTQKKMTPTAALEPPTEHLRCFCLSIPHNRPRQGRRLGLWLPCGKKRRPVRPPLCNCAAGKSFSRTTADHPMSQYHQASAQL